ncbi:MAG: glycerol-3-phosphate dehydrogenase [Pseudomonadota bacterium]
MKESVLAAGDYDLVVVGGGINGAGIARDAAGRGLSVLLCEKDDLAQHTSSASTKLIHGGLRYLERYQFSLVRKALGEREVLLRAAPHIIRPLRFVLPHDRGQRPAWLIRAGLFLYDHLARRQLLPGCEAIDLRRHVAGGPLRPGFAKGFVYSDAWVDDARLVVLVARDAAERGAHIHPRTACVAARRAAGRWRVTLREQGGGQWEVSGRALVNAGGPWVAQVLQQVIGLPVPREVRLVKGSHIVVPRLFDHAYAYIFQNPDRRIIFAIPFEDEYTLIGTTDVDYGGDPQQVAIDEQETRYLCAMASRYFARAIGPGDVVWSYSGVRPLLDHESPDPAGVTRDYALELDRAGAPLLSVFGGKITTFRKLAEEALDKLLPVLGGGRGSWTAGAPLPGGDLPDADTEAFIARLRQRHPWLPEKLARRYGRAYGTRAELLLGGARSLQDLGAEIVPGLYEAEAGYLVAQEWARSAEDILWRRSKLGLHLPPSAVQQLDAWLAAQACPPVARIITPINPRTAPNAKDAKQRKGRKGKS